MLSWYISASFQIPFLFSIEYVVSQGTQCTEEKFAELVAELNERSEVFRQVINFVYLRGIWFAVAIANLV